MMRLQQNWPRVSPQVCLLPSVSHMLAFSLSVSLFLHLGLHLGNHLLHSPQLNDTQHQKVWIRTLSWLRLWSDIRHFGVFFYRVYHIILFVVSARLSTYLFYTGPWCTPSLHPLSEICRFISSPFKTCLLVCNSQQIFWLAARRKHKQ